MGVEKQAPLGDEFSQLWSEARSIIGFTPPQLPVSVQASIARPAARQRTPGTQPHRYSDREIAGPHPSPPNTAIAAHKRGIAPTQVCPPSRAKSFSAATPANRTTAPAPTPPYPKSRTTYR